MPMSPRTLRPRQTTHPEAAAWASRVVTNGGSVSGTTLTAVSRLCRSIDQNGLRGKFLRLNLYCGSNLDAALTPLYRSASFGGTIYGHALKDTQANINSTHYSETLGIQCNARTVFTGLSSNETFSVLGSFHAGFIHTAQANAFADYCGSLYTRTSQSPVPWSLTRENAGNLLQLVWGTGPATTSAGACAFRAKTYITGCQTTSESSVISNGTKEGAVSGTTASNLPTGYYAFVSGDASSDTTAQQTGTNGYAWMYSMGASLTTSENASMHSILINFFTAIGRT